NQLSGGNGNDILIGRGGADGLVGGGGDDILIGGSTTYDGSATSPMDLTALDAIIAERSRTDSFSVRPSKAQSRADAHGAGGGGGDRTLQAQDGDGWDGHR